MRDIEIRERESKPDFTSGPLAGKIIRYSIPLMFTGVLQLLYTAADAVVAGRYAENGEVALAAVGSCGALIQLIVNLFMGLAVGAGICVANDYGAKKFDGVSDTVHTAIPVAVVLGVCVSAVGFAFARTFLSWTGVKDSVLEAAVPYMKAYMVGMPAAMVYNYCAAILRATGDTVRPLVFLSVSGIANFALNLLAVLRFNMGALGVGIASAVSNWISMFLILGFMMRSRGCVRYEIGKTKINREKFGRIVSLGLMAGIQGCLFSISNVLIQSSVNGFPRPVIAGNFAGANIDGFIYITMHAFYDAALTFAGQNVGAEKYDRVKRSTGICCLMVTITGIVLSGAFILAGHPLLSLYAPGNEPAIAAGMRRLIVVGGTYFICGLMDVLCGAIRGMGNSFMPMITTLCGVCAVRVLWIYTVFRQSGELDVLYLSFPVSWIIADAALIAEFFLILGKIRRKKSLNANGIDKVNILC